MAKKQNFIQSLLLLGAIAGIGFTIFENREALGQKLGQRKTTVDGLTPNTSTQTTKPIQTQQTPSQQATPDIIPVSQQVSVSARPIEQAPRPVRPISKSTKKRFQQIDTTPQVRKPEFLSSTSILNPKAFNKKKFGIDTSLLTSALEKSASDRSIDERKQIEQERARNVFDSRSISNF